MAWCRHLLVALINGVRSGPEAVASAPVARCSRGCRRLSRRGAEMPERELAFAGHADAQGVDERQRLVHFGVLARECQRAPCSGARAGPRVVPRRSGHTAPRRLRSTSSASGATPQAVGIPRTDAPRDAGATNGRRCAINSSLAPTWRCGWHVEGRRLAPAAPTTFGRQPAACAGAPQGADRPGLVALAKAAREEPRCPASEAGLPTVTVLIRDTVVLRGTDPVSFVRSIRGRRKRKPCNAVVGDPGLEPGDLFLIRRSALTDELIARAKGDHSERSGVIDVREAAREGLRGGRVGEVDDDR